MSGPHKKFAQTTTAGVVRPLPIATDDATLLEGLRDGDPWARRAIFDRYAPYVERVLGRVMGHDPELPDILHDTFVQVYESVGGLREAHAIKRWLASVAVFTARGVIRRRKLRRWLRFWDPHELPEPPPSAAEPNSREVLRRTYTVLDAMPAEERIAFTLRFVDGMELTEAAAVCGCSLATIKRRIARAEQKFLKLARNDELLGARIEGGRWANR